MTKRNSSPRMERIAFQIWWLIRDSAGECTFRDMAGFTGAPVGTCRAICRHRRWSGDHRKADAEQFDGAVALDVAFSGALVGETV